MADYYSFGEWLKQRRKQLKLTQREIAGAVYFSTSMIKKLEADERQPSPELAQALADVLQVSPEQRSIFLAVARGQRPVEQLLQGAEIEGVRTASRLPTPATPFIGREKELAEVTALLERDDVRLVSLLGPGGIGKTRLSLEAARIAAGDFIDGALFVPLAAVSHPDDFPQAIAQAMRISLIGNETPAYQLQRLFQRRALLLVLDNFEQLVEGAGLLSDWITAAPGLKILVSSRERLNVAGEWLFNVQGLVEETAVQLFAQTAQRVQPGFDSEAEAAAVRRICQLVEGHPLAVELAASWTRFMPGPQIVAKIQQDIDFLASRSRSSPQRHRSLRALFDHSWQLLSPPEQSALAKLSVFRGGFMVAQAAAVAGATWPLLTELVDKSLVETRGDGRFQLHELTRQFATAKLAEMGQLDETRQAYFAVFATLAGDLSEQLIGPQAISSFARLQEEQNNFQAALAWGLESRRPEAVLKLTNDLFYFWARGGYWQEGERWLTPALEMAGEQESVYSCLGIFQLISFLGLQRRIEEAFSLLESVHRMARRLEEPLPMIYSLVLEGATAANGADMVAAFEKAIAISRQDSDVVPFKNYMAEIMQIYGERLLRFGQIEKAKTLYEESVAMFRAVGDVYMLAYPLGNLGRIALQVGRLRKAHDLFSESVALVRQGQGRIALADWLSRLGLANLYLGQLKIAESNLQETLRLYEEVNSYFGPPFILSCLAMVALERGDVETAAADIQASFSRYRELQTDGHQIDDQGDYSQVGDVVDSIIIAGLVIHAQADWQRAAKLLSAAESLGRQFGYEPVRPLREKVTAVFNNLQAKLDASDFIKAGTKAEQISLENVFRLV